MDNKHFEISMFLDCELHIVPQDIRLPICIHCEMQIGYGQLISRKRIFMIGYDSVQEVGIMVLQPFLFVFHSPPFFVFLFMKAATVWFLS